MKEYKEEEDQEKKEKDGERKMAGVVQMWVQRREG